MGERRTADHEQMYDYETLGLVAGLEIHQQLDTPTKLFCRCPTDRRAPDEAHRRVSRVLHPTRSELGELDQAAVEESRVDRRFEYLAFDSTCLVEEDDEPPHEPSDDAVEVALEIAALLEMAVVDQAQVMRKIVVDGSNTSGFQRSMLIATDGVIETDAGTVGITDLLLEEESAARIEETDMGVIYGLDRLGIPLVEIGTAPDIRSPEGALAAAEQLGMLLRSTGAVKRGLGTIRQDVNVSIAEGARVELKGVQQLDLLDEIVRLEVHRQVRLLDIADALADRDATVDDPIDVTAVFSETSSGIIRTTLDDGGTVVAIHLRGFDGLVGAEIQPDRRLGTEFSDHAKRSGAGGIFHTDELPAYGITADEVAAVRDAVGAGPDDAVALVADDPDTAEQSAAAVIERARLAITDVPEETRGVADDGTSRYLRPLPGAARMYPETDVIPIDLDPTAVEVPELLTEKVERYRDELGLDLDLAEQVATGPMMATFEAALDRGVDATLAATTITGTLTQLRRDDVPVEVLTDEAIVETLAAAAAGDLAKEAIGPVLAELAEQPELDPETAAEALGFAGADDTEVREIIRGVVDRNAEQVADEGMAAFSALMGECMAELRGRADGELVSTLLREEIAAVAD